jgi:NAD(P)H dehydrogenase (quinone)
MERALAGVERLVLISASEAARRVQQHSNVLGAAKRAGVSLVIYTSLLHADRSPLAMARDHLATEAELRSLGLCHIVLRNGWYHDNYTISAKPSLAHGGYIGCAGSGRISSAARADYAAAVVAALIGRAEEGRTYELAGDEFYTLPMLAEEISRLSGRRLSYINVPESEFASVLASVGIPRALAEDIAGWDTAASKGALFDDGHELSTLIGRPTTPIVEALREVLR